MQKKEQEDLRNIELVSKVVKQQEDMKKKCRQKLMGEEAFERQQEKFFKPL